MTTTIFLAVIGAALLHAAWNALVKNGADKLVSLTAVMFGHTPFAIVAVLIVPPMGAEALPYLTAGILLHLGYQLGNTIALGAIIAARAPQTFGKLWQNGHRLFWVGGGASFIAYAIVIWAFTQAPIALVTALRENSIIFALPIGLFFLKERLDLMKVFSTMTVLIGAALPRLARP